MVCSHGEQTHGWVNPRKKVQSAAKSTQKQSVECSLMETNVQITEKKENTNECQGIKTR